MPAIGAPEPFTEFALINMYVGKLCFACLFGDLIFSPKEEVDNERFKETIKGKRERRRKRERGTMERLRKFEYLADPSWGCRGRKEINRVVQCLRNAIKNRHGLLHDSRRGWRQEKIRFYRRIPLDGRSLLTLVTRIRVTFFRGPKNLT